MTVAISGVGLVAPGVRGPADLLSEHRADPASDWFDPVAQLGRRGWKYLPPATRYLVAAARQALTDVGAPANHRPEDIGVCCGTQHAVNSLHARLDEVISREGTAGLSPAELPGFSVNHPASHLAITLGCRAFSVTLTNPVVAGLDAILFSTAALMRGRARRVLAVATEDSAPGYATGGAAALVLDRATSSPMGLIRGGLSRFVPVDGHGMPDLRAVDTAVHRIRELAGSQEGAHFLWCGPEPAAPVDVAIHDRLSAVETVVPGHRLPGADARFGAVSGLMRLVAAVMAGAGPRVVVAVSGTGHVVAVSVEGASTPV